MKGRAVLVKEKQAALQSAGTGLLCEESGDEVASSGQGRGRGEERGKRRREKQLLGDAL